MARISVIWSLIVYMAKLATAGHVSNYHITTIISAGNDGFILVGTLAICQNLLLRISDPAVDHASPGVDGARHPA